MLRASMNRVVALLAAVLASAGLAACGGGGAEPGAPRGATLVLDFQPNAVHAGIYAALAQGYYRDAGVDLQVQQPSASTDAPKLLEAGRAQFAILDIHDLAIARERGLDVVGVAPIVQRPAGGGDRRETDRVRTPSDLDGRRRSASRASPPTTQYSTRCSGAGGGDPPRRPPGDDRLSGGRRRSRAGKRRRRDGVLERRGGHAARRMGFRSREFRVDQLRGARDTRS